MADAQRDEERLLPFDQRLRIINEQIKPGYARLMALPRARMCLSGNRRAAGCGGAERPHGRLGGRRRHGADGDNVGDRDIMSDAAQANPMASRHCPVSPGEAGNGHRSDQLRSLA